MNNHSYILLLIIITWKVTSILCCTRDSRDCPKHESRNQHDGQPQNRTSYKSQQIRLEDTSTSRSRITTTRPIKGIVEIVRGKPGTIVQSIEYKELNKDPRKIAP